MPLTNRLLGKKPATRDDRTLKFGDYLTKLPPIPASRSWASQSTLPVGMLGNDAVGDCVIAGMLHQVQVWRHNADPSSPFVPTDQQATELYSALTGYVPGDESTDQGTDMLAALRDWRRNGVYGHSLGAFVSVNPKNASHLDAAIDLFGGVLVGLDLPLTVEQQETPSATWTVGSGPDAKPGSLGGHCVLLAGYGAPMEDYEVVSWGAYYGATAAFVAEYCDEAYALLSPDWLSPDKVAPSGFDLAQLQTDLRAVAA